MTQDQGDEFRLETEEQEDVEAHGGLPGPFGPFDRERADDEGDDVEAHGGLPGPFDRERADDEGDEVEGHAAFGPFAPDKPEL